jgi:DNA-binding LacI/PurR family transcriptional regulator
LPEEGEARRTTTLRDVARLAKTSKSTVSRHLNGQRVKARTAEAIRQAMLQLDYHPNANARRLASSRARVLGVVLDDVSNAFYSGILYGIGDGARSEGYGCAFYNMLGDCESEASFVSLVYEGRVDGLIMVSFLRRSPELAASIGQSGVPVALFGDDGGEGALRSVDVDNFGGAAEAVRHLIRLGHERIAHISGSETAAASVPRSEGYLKALEEAGLEREPSLIEPSDWTAPGGYRAMRSLLERGGFTAVFASNDGSAAGALKAAQETGLRVPEDLAVVGFDDSEFASLLSPALTTVRQPWYGIGARLARAALSLVEGDEVSPQREIMRPELVVRESCGSAVDARTFREKAR